MPRSRTGRLLGLAGAVAFACTILSPAVAQEMFGCFTCATGGHCQRHHCPPPLRHCFEGPPHIHWKRGCPRPICDPCALPNYGYFQTCWTPWPDAGNWSHCSVPPPAAFVQLGPPVAIAGPTAVTPGVVPPSPTGVMPNVPRPLPSAPGTQPGRPMIPSDFDPTPLPAPRSTPDVPGM